MFSASEILDLAVQIEENGEHFYRKALTRLSDQSLREVLLWVADEEAAHRESFLEMKRLAPGNTSDQWAEQVSGAMLKSSLQDHLFSLDEIDLEAVPGLDALLETALVLEQDSVTFYEIIAAFVTEPDTVNQLKAIIAEEEKHIAALKERQRALREPFSATTAPFRGGAV
jgi:rubrerythrin